MGLLSRRHRPRTRGPTLAGAIHRRLGRELNRKRSRQPERIAAEAVVRTSLAAEDLEAEAAVAAYSHSNWIKRLRV